MFHTDKIIIFSVLCSFIYLFIYLLGKIVLEVQHTQKNIKLKIKKD